jgi:uncharacterized damage-inducible protein DinB
MNDVVQSIRGEYLRYKALGEGAFQQLSDAQLNADAADSNSIAVIVWHISGNLRSRFTDFLTTDGEKPWRKRDEEFESRTVSRAEMIDKWEQGWMAVLGAMDSLTDAHLGQLVTIRSQSLTVRDALLRSLAHTSYHVGQIVYIAKSLRGGEWKSLSIPKGESAAFNRTLGMKG